MRKLIMTGLAMVMCISAQAQDKGLTDMGNSQQARMKNLP